MTVSVLVEGILKDELVDDFVQICKGAYSVTLAYDGCQSITLNLNVDNRNNFVMTEVWDSKEHYEKYLAFRTEEGTMDAIASMCLDVPTIRIFDITEA